LQTGKNVHKFSTKEVQQCIKHTFAPDDRLKPAKIEVNGRKNRRFMVVLGEDCRQMRILDLDFKESDVAPKRADNGVKHGDGHDDHDDEMMDD
jgi:anaphase-promoting complex subunit 4